MLDFVRLFVLLMAGHALADYALQSTEMVVLKNPTRPEAFDIDGEKMGPWWWWMTAHALINGLVVYVITGAFWALCYEAFMHWLLDWSKCRGGLTTHADQLGHIIIKAIIAGACTWVS